MRENRETAIRLIGLAEGGYANDKNDPGGETNFGITARTYAAWNIKTGRPQRSVRELTKGEADEIIAAQYFEPVQFDALPAGVDYLVADFAVNSGPARAAKELQSLVGVTADGIIGLQTIAAVRAADQVQLINGYCERRMKFLRGLRTWRHYKNGWTSRVTAARAQALTMAGAAAQPTAILPSPRAREEDVSMLAEAKKPQIWAPLSAVLAGVSWPQVSEILSSTGSIVTGHGPVQYALAAVLVIVAGAGAVYLMRRPAA